MDSGRKQAVIIKTGEKIDALSSVPGDYEDWIGAGLGTETTVVDVARGEVLPPIAKIAMIAITGSGAMVTEHALWMEQTAAWLREAVAEGIPVLGICFGHQLLAEALGGEVGYNPAGLEVGTTAITLNEDGMSDPLFKGLPAKFAAQVTHRQSVLRLPPGAKLLASSDKDANQAFVIGHCAWGIQFHPEFDDEIIRYFINYYRELLVQEGDSAEGLLATTSASPESAGLLYRFAQLAMTCDKGVS